MNNISQQIRKYRNQKGLTQEQLGEVVGVSMQAVSKWERGGTPDIELLPAIADALGVSIDELFGRRQKSLEERITEVVYAMDPEESYDYAYKLCWAVLSGLAHISGNVRGRLYEKPEDSDRCYFSKLVSDSGIACARYSPDFRTFFLMPEPNGSIRDNLADIDKLQKLFEAFADPDLLKILFYLYSRTNVAVDKSFISLQTGIPEKRVEQIMEIMRRNQLVFHGLGTTADGDIDFYMFFQESAVIPMLIFADEIMTEDIRDFIVDFSRTKPLF